MRKYNALVIFSDVQNANGKIIQITSLRNAPQIKIWNLNALIFELR